MAKTKIVMEGATIAEVIDTIERMKPTWEDKNYAFWVTVEVTY